MTDAERIAELEAEVERLTEELEAAQERADDAEHDADTARAEAVESDDAAGRAFVAAWTVEALLRDVSDSLDHLDQSGWRGEEARRNLPDLAATLRAELADLHGTLREVGA